jgi:hypothetical protein
MMSSRRGAVERHLDDLPWAYETATFATLGFAFSVRTTEPELGAHLDALYAECVAPRPVHHARYTVRERPGQRGSRLVVHCDGERVISTPYPSVALDFLVWDINRRTAAAEQGALLVHAGAVSAGDRAVIVPGASGAGKSTLVAALVQAGFSYLTDETLAIDRGDGRIRGAAKPIGLKQGSWALFGNSLAAPGAARYTSTTRHVAIAALGGTVAGDAPLARLIVLPRFAGNSGVRTEPVAGLSRARTIALLAEQSFNFASFGPERLGLLARVVGSCATWVVDTSDLPRAVESVSTLLTNKGHRS